MNVEISFPGIEDSSPPPPGIKIESERVNKIPGNHLFLGILFLFPSTKHRNIVFNALIPRNIFFISQTNTPLNNSISIQLYMILCSKISYLEIPRQ